MTAGIRLNAFLSSNVEQSLECAAAIDKKIKSGTAGACAGMTLAVKDNISIADLPCTCGSKILENFSAVYTATAVERLRAADAIVIGKTNMDEFAMGSSNENSAFGPAMNPVDPNRIPGGSSGGSAVAVAAGMTHGALGSERAGASGNPRRCAASSVSNRRRKSFPLGLVAFASSFDQIGAFAATVEDAALILQTIAGVDPHDATSADVGVPDYCDFLDRDITGMRIGVPAEYMGEGCDAAVRSAVELTIDRLKHDGATVDSIALPHTDYCIATYCILTMAEASSNLARYDGVRYGYRAKHTDNLYDMYARSRDEGFGTEVKRRIMLGTYVLSAGYYDAYYKKAQKVRRLIKEDFDGVFAQYDAILTPTAPTTA